MLTVREKIITKAGKIELFLEIEIVSNNRPVKLWCFLNSRAQQVYSNSNNKKAKQ